jgi:hypothetical protein
MVARKARRSHEHEPVQGSDSRPKFVHGVCGGSPQNCRVPWLSHKAKTGGSAGEDGIRARRVTSKRGGGTRRACGACVERKQTAEKAWPPAKNIQVLTILPLRGMYLSLSCRGSVVFCLHLRDFIYIALGLDGNLSI